MKRLKKGFTLAEVLITLGIIGVVAALVMPSVISSYQYKTVGVKLTKFASMVEGAARPFVVTNENFRELNSTTGESADLVNTFIEEAFLITNKNEYNSPISGDLDAISTAFTTFSSAAPGDSGTNKDLVADTSTKVLELKDGTRFAVSPLNSNYNDTIANLENSAYFDDRQVGQATFIIRFAPNVNGLPNVAQHSFDFVITELGYIYPHQSDSCLVEIVDNNYATNGRTFARSICSSSSNAQAQGQGGTGN